MSSSDETLDEEDDENETSDKEEVLFAIFLRYFNLLISIKVFYAKSTIVHFNTPNDQVSLMTVADDFKSHLLNIVRLPLILHLQLS